MKLLCGRTKEGAWVLDDFVEPQILTLGWLKYVFFYLKRGAFTLNLAIIWIFYCNATYCNAKFGVKRIGLDLIQKSLLLEC